VVVMDSGRLLAEGAPDVVLAREDVVEAYLGK
jgi:ABC-type branched-subunit amino acid transport system ATPase component